MSEWLPIDTAPKDGTKIDVWQRDLRYTNAFWSGTEECWCIDGPHGPEEPTPLAIAPAVSHWMPVPKDPK